MGLARRTVKDVRDLKIVLEHLDESTGSVFLTIFTNRMKDLAVETGMIEAREKYESAVKTFENLNDLIKTKSINIQEVANEKWAKEVKEQVYEECKILNWFSFGLCSALGTVWNGPDLRPVVERFERKIDKRIKEANDILNEEIDMISIWNKSARVVGKNIDDYPAEILMELKSVKTIFINGLDDLKNVAEQFLDQPTDILEIEKLTW